MSDFSRRWTLFYGALALTVMAGVLATPAARAATTSAVRVGERPSPAGRALEGSLRTLGADDSAATATGVIVQYKPGTSRASQAAIRKQRHAALRRQLAIGSTELVSVPKGSTARKLAESLRNDPRVALAVPNVRVHRLATGAPSFYGSEWGLNNSAQAIPYWNWAIGNYDTLHPTPGSSDVDVDAPQAWTRTKGKRSVIVAVTDSGVDINHPDLSPAIYTNPGEIAGNGVDDDGNGFVDDVHGWDFCADGAPGGDGSVFDDPIDDAHGTHVAGTIAAADDGHGTVGVAPGVTILPVKFLGNEDNSDGCANGLDRAFEALEYAASQGARIINASWGVNLDVVHDSAEIVDLNQFIAALGTDHGSVIVAAAGNDGIDMDRSSVRTYPAALWAPNLLSVAAVDSRGRRMPESNYGRTLVDIAAPGVSILSTIPDDNVNGYDDDYAWADGTSMAAPHASGVAALLLSAYPATSAAQVVARLKATAKHSAALSSLTTTTVSGGIVSAHLAMAPASWLAIGPSVTTVNYHSSVTLTGSLRDAVTALPIAGQRLSLYFRYRAGTRAWNYAGTYTTDAAGVARGTRVLLGTADWQWRYAGASAHPAINSALKGVVVRSIVTLALTRTTARPNYLVGLRGQVTPAAPGQRIYIQRLVGSTWRNLATAPISSTGGYAFNLRVTTKGVWTLRTVRQADPYRALGVSPNRSVTVS